MSLKYWAIYWTLLTGALVAETAAPEGEPDPTPEPAGRNLVDQVFFPNGDRLSGEIVHQTQTEVVFRSSALGEITLQRDEVKVVPGSPPSAMPVEALVGLAPIPSPAKDASTTASVEADTSADSTGTTPPPVDHIADNTPPAKKDDDWKGNIEFGLRQQQGRRDVFAMDLRGSADRHVGPNDLRAEARLLYGEQDSQVNNDRYEGSFQWRRELGERTFAQSLTTYYEDNLKDIKRNWEQNIGAGYRLLETEGHVVNLGAGLTGQYREASFSPSGFATLIEVFQDYTYQVNQRITFRQDAQAQFSPDGGVQLISTQPQPGNTAFDDEASNYKIRFNSVLQGKLTEQLSMNLRFEFEYDNAIRPTSARTDQRIISSLGYAF